MPELKNEQDKTVSKLKTVRAEFARNGFEASKMAETQSALRRQMGEANKEIDKQKQKLAQLNQKAQEKAKLDQRLNALRTKAEQYANIGGRAAATYSAMKEKVAVPVVEFAKAETAATNLKVAMMGKDGKVSAEFEQINQLATNLGNKLPGTTADFQNLMTMLVRQGMSAKTILGGTGEAAALLSVQLNMMPEQAAEFAAKMQDATQGTEIEMLDLMDTIQRGFYAGVDSTNMLGAFKNLAPALSILKVKGKEAMDVLAPLVAQMDQAGMDGMASGNALRKVFQKGLDVDKVEKTIINMKKAGQLGKHFNLISQTVMANHMYDPNYEPPSVPQKWTGGYGGAGGKYEPKGIYHGGEYIMTKEATARLGVANLNRLNYGGMAGVAALASTVALAQPMTAVKVDTRPPLTASQPSRATAPVAPNIQITINATSGQNPQEIARMLTAELDRRERQAQAKARSSLRDRVWASLI